MPRVFVLTAGYGEGHNSAARALQAALQETPGVEARLVDVFALASPRLNQLTRRGYLGLINTAPRLWSSFYRWLDRSPRAPALFRALRRERAVLARLLREQQPDLLVSTYPLYAWLLADLRRAGLRCPPLHTVVTDALTINSLWYRAPSAGWFVTDPDSAALLREQGIPADRVHASGFPVALAFADRPAAWQPPDPAAGPRVLFIINTARRTALPVARELLQHRDWSVTLTAGRNAALRRELEDLARHAPARATVLGWTDRIPELLMSHHLVISKAGGATTQEAINAHCPMIISQIVPGQEEGNSELLQRHRAGTLATTPTEIIRAVQATFAHDAARWHHARHRLRQLARPAAARDIAARVLAAGAGVAATDR